MKTKFKKTNKLGQVLYGGYVSWMGPNRTPVLLKEVRVWGPVEWEHGDGTEIMEAVEKKARNRWKKANCRECWRY